MPKQKLIDRCIKESSYYLDYLEKHLENGGKIYDYPLDIDYDEGQKSFELLLEKRIIDFDRIHFEVKDLDLTLYLDKDVFVKHYDEENNILKISIKHKKLESHHLNKEHFAIVSDLTFLIKNLIDWYKEVGDELTFKAKPYGINPDINILKKTIPNPDQKLAIETIFKNAYSYIWGPPGTGKTKVVLSNCVINNLHEGKKVLIVAPTNIAIEQALTGLIEHFLNLGFPLSDLFRFGHATNKFQAMYPQTCIEYKESKSIDLFSVEDEKKETNVKKLMLKRLKRSRVVAMTLDTFISLNISLEFEFDHIFCDEIGYAPIIKTLPLFSQKVPVTFLGDHMQLPPISELNSNDEQSTLFSKSGVFIEEVINTRFLASTALKTTHRFGPNLASILDTFIYKNHFTSDSKEPTELLFIDSKSKPENGHNRTSKEEVNKIKEALMYSNFNHDFAILTPYNAQAFLLRKSLHKIYEQKIFTVHKSQGSEYETVIFSVVDDAPFGKRGMFFTDSNSPKSNGLNLINTVVSRTKKRLIIVGNYHFWTHQQNQLIGALFKIAKPLKN